MPRLRLLLFLMLADYASLVHAATMDVSAALGIALKQQALVGGSTEALYRKVNLQFLWVNQNRPSEAARGLITELSKADAAGLRPEDYGTAALLESATALSTDTNIQLLAAFDVELTRNALRYVHDLHFGRINPRQVGFELDVPRQAFDATTPVINVARGADPTREFATAEPRFYHYGLLKQALAVYRQLEQQAPPAFAKPIRPLKLGDVNEVVPALRRKLLQLGDLEDNSIGSGLTFDSSVSAALGRFQSRHGLRASRTLDAATYQALSKPLSARVEQIELTLERWRWIPEFPSPPIIVNIPQFRLFAFDSLADRKAAILQMDVIVGRTFPSAHTPVFMANMTSVIFRPFWQVPFAIVKKEILPRALRDPNYLASEQLEIVPFNDEGSKPVAASRDNLQLLASGKLKLRQRPGPQNSLGLIKFSLPNPHDVYLHSTPTPSLFQQPVRAFSHGCIRVSEPIALAVHVLRNTSGEWTVESVSAAMHAEETRHVGLARPIPVLILYGTALATEDGKISFFNDIYGHDAKLAAALKVRDRR